VDTVQLLTRPASVLVVLELPADRIARRIIDVVSPYTLTMLLVAGRDNHHHSSRTGLPPSASYRRSDCSLVMDRVLESSSYSAGTTTRIFLSEMDMDWIGSGRVGSDGLGKK